MQKSELSNSRELEMHNIVIESLRHRRRGQLETRKITSAVSTSDVELEKRWNTTNVKDVESNKWKVDCKVQALVFGLKSRFTFLSRYEFKMELSRLAHRLLKV